MTSSGAGRLLSAQPDSAASRRHHVRQMLLYLASGSVYLLSGYILFAVLWSGLGWSLWWAKLAANIFGWSVNFLLQRFWVFGREAQGARQLRLSARYAAITLVDFLLDYLLIAGLRRAGITPYIGQLISALCFTVWNYLWYRFWVFRRMPYKG